jgi:predicted NodU family carbamoyl transferase
MGTINNRSIFSDLTEHGIKEKINSAIKNRDFCMSFLPVIFSLRQIFRCLFNKLKKNKIILYGFSV